MLAAESSTDHLRRLRAQRVAAARRGFASFLELCISDEETGLPLVLAPMHREWTRIVRAQTRAMIWAFVGSGKTSILAVGYVLWRLGTDPTLRVGILRNGEEQAREIIRLLARHIESNETLHEIFPHLRKAAPWNEGAVSVQRPTYAKDASVRAYGIMSNVYGARLDLLVCDDIVDNANSMTATPRDHVAAKYFSEVQNRLLGSEKAQLLVIGTPFHRDDLYHRLEALGMPLFKFPVLAEDGAPRWPERWPPEKIAAARREVPPAEAARSLDLRILDEATQVFRDEWLLNALARGEQHTPLSRAPNGWGLLGQRPGWKIAVGCDPAVSRRHDADLRAVAVVLRREDGRTKELLEVQSGRWGTPETTRRIIDAYKRFGAEICVVEGVGFQASLKDWIREFAAEVNVVPYMTNGHALHLRHRVGDMEVALQKGEWLIPAVGGRPRDREADALLRDMRFFHRDDHPPDRLVATMLATWGLDEITKRRVETLPYNLLSR